MAAPIGDVSALMNGKMSSSNTAEDEQLYTHLLRLQDRVLAGSHPQFKLPAAVIEQLKAALIVPGNVATHATNQASSLAETGSTSANGPSASNAHGGLDPIFLQKSDSLVRAERLFKRQRLEHDVQSQGAQRWSFRPGNTDAESPFLIGTDEVLRAAHERVKPASGLRPPKAAMASVSSFDENDYYSSRAPSPWSSDDESKGSDKGAGAEYGFKAAGKRPADAMLVHQPAPVYDGEDDDLYEPEDDDDEYTPPDATNMRASRQMLATTGNGHITPDDDDNSEYEPGEITQESTVPTPYQYPPYDAQPSPRVPVIRNHLTHIVAPQPNRVSPLATAKGPNIELELVNGRPEIVHKSMSQYRSVPQQSRASTASPVNVPGGSGKKTRRNKKRKRDQEPPKSGKKRQDRHVARSPPSPAHRLPYIKDEPVSPPPFIAAPEVSQYQQQYRAPPPHVDLLSPAQPPRPQYIQDPQPSSLRYEYAQPASPAVIRVASPAAYRPVQRTTQDLRRAVSMRHAQRAPTPPRVYSPVGPYRAASAAYPSAQHALQPEYNETTAEQRVQYVRAPSPPRLQEYQDPYARAASPVVMVPPPATRRIVVDQYGNRYYAAEPLPAPTPSRATYAPTEERPEPLAYHERAASRVSVAYQPAAVRYETMDVRMAPPPAPAREAQRLEYVDANSHRVPEYSTRLEEAKRYIAGPPAPSHQDAPRYETMQPPAPPVPEERTSPVYQPIPRFDAMPPPQALPQRIEATSPVYQPVSRAYSVRPDGMQPAPPPIGYVRQASVAPVQYSRHEMAPPPLPQQVRAVSVAPVGYGSQPAYGYAPQPQMPQNVRYVDQYGREVSMQHVRQESVARY